MSIAEQEDNEKDKEVMSINLAEIEKQSADILADLGEIVIDSFLKNGPIKDIPIFGSALKGIQGYKAIRDYFFIQKLYEFVRNPSTIDPEKRQQFRDKMAKDRNFAKRTAMHLTVVLDRLDELEKAALFAKIFSAYINTTTTVT